MPMNFKGILAFTAAAGFAGAASAADIYQAPPPISSPIYTPAPVFTWTGAYIGIQGGYDWNRAVTTPSGFASSIDGGIAGIYGGYNWQTATNWVVGIDASINYDWASGAVSGAPGYTGEVDWKGFVRGRLGYAWDRFMIYGTAGGAFAPLKAVDTGAGFGDSENPVKLGWAVGGGVEVALTDNVVARLDYTYADFGKYDYTSPVSFSATNKSHTVMGGIALKF
jgi:outer membrane immunogenic protein